MSSSARLRQTHSDIKGARGIQSIAHVKQESSVIEASYRTMMILAEEFPEVHFERQAILPLQAVMNEIKSKEHPEIGTFLFCEKSFIKPDGGCLFATYKGKRHLILAIEAKRQGTNRERANEGLRKQSKGNAIERAMKNDGVMKVYMSKEAYFPFALFASGCDFEADSSIGDRVMSATWYSPPNNVYVRNLQPGNIQRTSIFIRDKHWTSKETFDICLKVARESLDVVMTTHARFDIAA
jgi:type II restriction enzyme